MSIDRRIDLDNGFTQRFAPQTFEQAGTSLKSDTPPSDTDRKAFEDAMSAEHDAASAAAKPKANEALLAPPAPFALFGTARTDASGQAAVPSGLADVLSQSAEQLMINDQDGRREVRVELKDDVFPGVSVAVFENEGRLVAAFTCSDESSRERLAACAPALAKELAQSLSRATLVQVQTDDPDDPCLVEAGADASP
ncbi:hypothetical protein FXN63_22295 [Pigmentiphaga aceris]|uniref:Uncharacterized protein n=1 Tax=Pigmentiphaga aceris TaxID=1940612 RepID=A0A5C0B5X2_9BURK|nr:hypothetical protein [Pigmentiphaga aceris]QEI08261.1 hypothetical protein FXN63_22295 [Pigmentiphaga aceris]